LKEIEARIEYLKSLLANPEAIYRLIKQETHELAEKYGDDRRTEIVPSQVEQINLEDLIKPEEVAILISNKGFIKRIPVSQYRSQGRGGKGSNSTSLLEDDFIQQLFIANTHDYLLFISSWGKAYWLKVLEIPEASRQARGSHVRALLAISEDEEITAVVDFSDFSENQFILMGTLKGVVKKVATKEFANAKTRGIVGISLDEGDRLVSAILTGGSDEVVLISRKGLALRMKETEVRQMGRTARGVRGISLQEDDELAAMLRVDSQESMLIITQNGSGKRVKYELFTPHARGTHGQIIYDPDEASGEVIKAVSVREEDEVMVITSTGKTIKLSVSSVREMGKAAHGVRIVNIEPPDSVIGMDKIIQQQE